MNLNDSMCNSECFKSAPSMNRWILWSGPVRTLAGDGTKAEGDYIGGQRGSSQRLNSPWDLAFDQQVRTIAR